MSAIVGTLKTLSHRIPDSSSRSLPLQVGTGQSVKICNNMLLAISMIGVSETMNLGQRLGLDPKLLAEILSSATGRCWDGTVGRRQAARTRFRKCEQFFKTFKRKEKKRGP